MLIRKEIFQSQWEDQTKSQIRPIKSQKLHLLLQIVKKIDHFFQTKTYDLFCDGLYVKTKGNHALCTYEKTKQQIPLLKMLLILLQSI